MKPATFAIGAMLGLLMSVVSVSAREFSMELFADHPSIGCEANPTGNPIGGSEGYKDIYQAGDFTVADAAQLTAALAEAQAGQVIFIPDGAEIDLTGHNTLAIPGGVTLAGTRGLAGSAGARVFSTSNNFTMFRTQGDFIRVTGLRIEGQYGGRERLPYNGRFIIISHYNTRIDNCEIYNFSGHDAININTGAINTYIHHNFLHHIQRAGLGYPVRVDGSHTYVIANIFDYGRHHIASGGAPGAAYEAAWNLILENANGSHFDMHGGRDRGDNTDIAGDWMHIHHNTFISPLVHVGIRGTPSHGADIHHNWFARSAEVSVRSTANTRVFHNAFGPDKTFQVQPFGFVDRKPVEITVEACGFCSWTRAGAEQAFVPDSSRVERPAALHVLLDNSLEARRTSDQLLEAVAAVMALDEATVLGMISKDNGFGSVRCPACRSYVSRFDIHDPDRVACRSCGLRYPNDEYPETHIHEGVNQRGEPVQWRYYARDGHGYQYFFSAVLRQQRHHFLETMAKDLARLYHMTGDERYARRAIVIIVGLAEASVHWSVREDHPGPARGRTILAERPWHWRTGVWDNMVHSQIPINAVFAYDLTYTSATWENLTHERGGNVREPVEGWLRDAYRIAIEYQEDRGNRFGNLHPYAIRRIVALGRVLNDPDMVHAMVPWFAGVIESYFAFDGMGCEGTLGYHGQTVWNLSRAMNAIAGYTDPEGYVDMSLGIGLRDADMAGRFPILAKAQQVSRMTVFPDGSQVTIHDTTWHRGGGELAEAGNIELNAFGHFALGRGSGLHAMQVHLHFCPLTRYSHYHGDRLSMILWAAGGEMLADIGYARDPACYRYFATNRLSHNISYVGWHDTPEPPETEFASGELNTSIWARSAFLGYDSGTLTDKQVQLAAAASPGPQWQAADVAERLILLVAAHEQRSYVFDLFRLRGGDYHESILRPSADEDCRQTCSLDLSPRAGTLAGEDVPYEAPVPGRYDYRNLIHDLQVGDGSKHAVLTWTTEATGRTVRSFLMGEPDTEFILARAPLVRPANNVPAERDKYQGRYLLRRRQCGPETSSRFAALYDAWTQDAGPVVDRVEWLQPQPANDMAVAARVHAGDRRDMIYVSSDSTAREVDGLTVHGKAVLVSHQGEQVRWAYVWGGGVTGPGVSLTAPPVVQSPLRKVLREEADGVNGFAIADVLPEAPVSGAWLRVIHGDGSANGYRIDRVEPAAEGSRIVIAGLPGFEQTDTGMRMLYFPHYEIPGKQQIEIVRSAFHRFDAH